MRVLFLDTSSQIASVSAFDTDTLYGEFTVLADRTHSQRLMPMIDDFLKQLDLKTSAFDAFGVCVGPGSFTGVRIGMSTVKAFAQVHNKPVYGLTSMALLAGSCHLHRGVIAVALIANKDEVYYGFYNSSDNGLSVLEEGVESPEVVETRSKQYSDLLWIGDGASRVCNSGTILPLSKLRLSASNAQFWMSESIELVSYNEITAQYFKKSQAERDLK